MNRRSIKWLSWIMAMALAAMMFTGCADKADSKSDAEPKQEAVSEEKESASADAQTGEEKTVTVTVKHKDESVKEFTYTTEFEMLGDLLRDEKLVEGMDGSAGFYVTAADGEEAHDADQEWWMVMQNGEMTQTGVDEVKMADGDSFELVFTTGYY